MEIRVLPIEQINAAAYNPRVDLQVVFPLRDRCLRRYGKFHGGDGTSMYIPLRSPFTWLFQLRIASR